jgi:hypothetical protein
MRELQIIFGVLLPTFMSWLFNVSLLDVLQRLFFFVLDLPITALAFSGAILVYSINQNHFNNREPLVNRFRDNFFLLTNYVLNAVASGFLIAAAGVVTTLIGALFVAASVVNVIKDLTVLIQEYIAYKNNNTTAEDNLLSEKEALRYQFNYVKHRNALLSCLQFYSWRDFGYYSKSCHNGTRSYCKKTIHRD